MPRLSRGELQERVADTCPTLSGTQVRKVARQVYESGIEPSEWNIIETALAGRAPGDARRVCVAPRRQKRGGPDLDPATVSDQHRADPTARLGVRNALAAQRRVGA